MSQENPPHDKPPGEKISPDTSHRISRGIFGRGNAPSPETRTPEQHAAVRRRALPVGVAAALLGVVGVVLLMVSPVSAFMPPNLLGVNLASCAVLMGAGILFYARGTSGTRVAVVASVIAILAGMAGTMVYTKQAFESRRLRENLELANVKGIAAAAQEHAREHGAFPKDMLEMLEAGDIKMQAFQSPYGKRSPYFDSLVVDGTKLPAAEREARLKKVEEEADYVYIGDDLKAVPAELGKDIWVAASKTTVERESYALGFADGSARFITLAEVGPAQKACNEARAKLGLGPVKMPEVLENAIKEEGAKGK